MYENMFISEMPVMRLTFTLFCVIYVSLFLPDTGQTTGFTDETTGLIFFYRTDESPFSWQEAYNEATANGRRLPTITELRTVMTNYPSIIAPFNGLDIWSDVPRFVPRGCCPPDPSYPTPS